MTPYDPANKLIFGAGALADAGPGGPVSKMNISTLSPMTGGWGSSCSDTYVGGQLKYAGFDSIIVEGRAHMPVYLWIEDGRLEVRDANAFLGKDHLGHS